MKIVELKKKLLILIFRNIRLTNVCKLEINKRYIKCFQRLHRKNRVLILILIRLFWYLNTYDKDSDEASQSGIPVSVAGCFSN